MPVARTELAMSSHMGSRPVADAAVTASCFSLRPAKLCHPEMKRRATFQSSTKCFSEIYQKKKKKNPLPEITSHNPCLFFFLNFVCMCFSFLQCSLLLSSPTHATLFHENRYSHAFHICYRIYKL